MGYDGILYGDILRYTGKYYCQQFAIRLCLKIGD